MWQNYNENPWNNKHKIEVVAASEKGDKRMLLGGTQGT